MTMASDEHTKLQDKFLTWLSSRVTGRGIRGSRELTLADGYIVDALALCGFQYAHLRRMCREWGLMRNGRWSDSPDYDRLGFNYFAVAAEVKVSRSDFLKTFGPNALNGSHANRHAPVADLHVIVTPKGLVKLNEVPDFWGLLEPAGAGLAVKKWPKLTRMTDSDRNSLADRVLWHSASETLRWRQICEHMEAQERMFRKLKAEGMSAKDAMEQSIWRVNTDADKT